MGIFLGRLFCFDQSLKLEAASIAYLIGSSRGQEANGPRSLHRHFFVNSQHALTSQGSKGATIWHVGPTQGAMNQAPTPHPLLHQQGRRANAFMP